MSPAELLILGAFLTTANVQEAALSHWGDVSAKCPNGVTEEIVPLDESYGIATVGSCHVQLSRDTLRAYRTKRSDTRMGRRSKAQMRCFIRVHEYGHAIGYTHADAFKHPVMHPANWDIPLVCEMWARRQYR